MRLQANGTAVVVNGSFVFVEDHDNVDVKWVRSRDAANGTRVEVVLEVGRSSEILDLGNTTYTINMYTDAGNRTRHFVNYSDGKAFLGSNRSAEKVEMTSNTTLSGPNPTKQNTITISILKSLFTDLSAWSVYATAKQEGSPYSYQDFGWEVPGNPGSTPTPPPSTPAKPFYQDWMPYIVAGLLVLALVVIVVLLTRRKRRGAVPPAK